MVPYSGTPVDVFPPIWPMIVVRNLPKVPPVGATLMLIALISVLYIYNKASGSDPFAP